MLWRKRKKRNVVDLNQGLLTFVENLGFSGPRNHWRGCVLSRAPVALLKKDVGRVQRGEWETSWRQSW